MDKRKILVVEDSGVMRSIIVDIVKCEESFDVVGESVDGIDALEKTKELNPDVILLDLEMPRMGGLEFMKRARLLTSAKIIVVSSIVQDANSTYLQAKELGAFDIISKPSGALSLNLKEKKGHEIIQAIKKCF